MKHSTKLLQNLTQKKYIYFTKKGRDAAKILIDILKPKELYLQDQGGWHTYQKLTKATKYLKTRNGKINPNHIKQKSTLIINSMPGYIYQENMNKIQRKAKQKKATLINDVCGSIGTKNQTQGDYIIGSFGRWKPVTIGEGGFIATNKKIPIKNEQLNDKQLSTALKKLNQRIKYLQKKKQETLKIIPKNQIMHSKQINILTKLTENLINTLQENNIPYEKCPLYIRSNKKAISIEIKRW